MLNKLRKEQSQDRSTAVSDGRGSAAEGMASKKERGRLGQLFGRKKDRDGNTVDSEPAPPSSTILHMKNTTSPVMSATGGVPTSSSSNTLHQDSAYAGSDATPRSPANRSEIGNSNSNIVPVENNGQISGVDEDRNLALNKLTGDVLDEDTGEVVTTTTTTTTTTTITTRAGGPGKKEVVEMVSRPSGANATQVGPRDSEISEMPADPAPPRPPPALKAPTLSPAYAVPVGESAPHIPQRSPNRRSHELRQRPAYITEEGVEPLPASPINGTDFGANFNHVEQTAPLRWLDQVAGPLASRSPSTPDRPPHPTTMGADPSRQASRAIPANAANFSHPGAHSSPIAHEPGLGGPIDHHMSAPQHTQQSGGNTLSNLKAAAKGIQVRKGEPLLFLPTP